MKRASAVLAVVLAFAALGCAGGNAASVRYLSIATGGTGGVYYPYGGALARVLSESLPGIQATAEVTNASVDNLKLMQLGKVDLAFTLADTLDEALKGTGAFATTGSIGSVRTVAVLYTNFTHIVVNAKLGAKRVSDLKGRVVSVGSPGSGTELIADRVLAAAGLDPRKDISRHSLSVSESAGALKDGKIDAFIWSGGVPTPAIQDLAATPGLAITLLPQDDLLSPFQSKLDPKLYRPAFIPPSSYRGLDAQTAVIGVTNLLVASSALDDQLVYDILKTMFEKKDALVAAHPEARHLEVVTSADGSPAAFHAGAIKYYKEHGWK